MTARLGTLEGRARSAAAFNRMVKLDAVGAMGLEYSFIAEPGECAALATRYEILAVAGLRATADLERTGAGARARVHFIADVVQSCVITLEPVEARIDQRFEVKFMPQDGAKSVENSGAAEQSVLVGDIAPIRDGVFDLGAVVAEYFSLAIDPYPRKSGIEFIAADYNDGETVDSDERRPFSALSDMISEGKGKT